MKLSEIRELYKDGQGIADGSMLNVKVETKDYISLTKKLMIIEGYDYKNDAGEDEHLNGIIDNIITEKDDLYMVNKFLYEMHLMFEVLRNYTDIDFEDLQFTPDDYDMFMRSGLWNTIIDSTNDFVQFVYMLEDAIKAKLELSNSLSKSIRDSANKLLSAINDMMDSRKLDGILKTVNKAIQKNPELKEYLKVYVEKNGANR